MSHLVPICPDVGPPLSPVRRDQDELKHLHLWKCQPRVIRPWNGSPIPVLAHDLVVRIPALTSLVASVHGMLSPTRGARFGSKWVRLDKAGTFSYQISVHLAHRAKCTEIWYEKVPDLSHMGSNLIHFGAKPTIPVPEHKQRSKQTLIFLLISSLTNDSLTLSRY